MFNSVKELQEFILWAKQNKLKSFKNKEIQFEISELSHIENLTPQDLENVVGDTLGDTADKEISKEDDDLLFWSSN